MADDKVRHKVFKIRCKRCDNAIVVRTDAEPEEKTVALDALSNVEGTRREDGAVSSESAQNVWHIVVNREQLGPMTVEDIAGYLGRGEVDDEAFVWCDGMDDWQKMSGLPAFSHLFAKNERQVENPFSQPQGDLEPAPAAVQGVQQPPEEEDVLMSGPDAAADGLFANVDAQQSTPRVDDPSALKDQRNENSVLFSLDALDAAAQRPAVTNTGGAEGSGLIDLSMLNVGGESGSVDSVFGGDAGVAGVEALGAPQQVTPFVTRRRSNTPLIVGLVAGFLVLAGAVATAVYFATKDSGGQKNVDAVAKAPSADADKTPKRTTLGNVAASDKVAKTAAPQPASALAETKKQDEKNTENTVGSAKTEKAETNTKAAQAPNEEVAAVVKKVEKGPQKKVASAKRRSEEQSRRKKRTSTKKVRKAKPSPVASVRPAPAPPKARPEPPKPKPKPKPKSSGGSEVDELLGALSGGGSKPKRRSGGRSPAPTAPASADPLLPAKLNRTQVLSVVRSQTGNILRCRSNDPDLRGVLKTRITVKGATGRVSSASVTSPNFQGTATGRCVISKIKSGFRFPRFSNPSQTLNLPFRM